jgi:hypothetical protein
MLTELRDVKSWLVVIVAMAALGPAAARAQSSVPASELETFLGLPVGAGLSTGGLDINGPAMNGSAIMQMITVSTGETLSFNYNFLTNAPSPASVGYLAALDPFAFVTQPVVTDFADNFSTLSPAPPTSGFLFETGIQTFSQTFTAPGTLSFGLGVVDVTTDQYSSGLAVSNFMLSSGGFPDSWSTIGNVSASGGPGDFIMSTSVPEPSSIALLVLGTLGAMVGFGRHRAKSKVCAECADSVEIPREVFHNSEVYQAG